MNDIDSILKLLSWNNSEQEQSKGIALAQNVSCLKSFFQPVTESFSKDVWENCAVIISQHTDIELQPYIIDMLLWLQDMNWPGAERIQKRLICFNDVEIISRALRSFVIALIELQEYGWLSALAELLHNKLIEDRLDYISLNLLRKYQST